MGVYFFEKSFWNFVFSCLYLWKSEGRNLVDVYSLLCFYAFFSFLDAIASLATDYDCKSVDDLLKLNKTIDNIIEKIIDKIIDKTNNSADLDLGNATHYVTINQLILYRWRLTIWISLTTLHINPLKTDLVVVEEEERTKWFSFHMRLTNDECQ